MSDGVRRGEVFAWPSMVKPPEGYRFVPDQTSMAHRVTAIVALRDHAERPRLSEEWLDWVDGVKDRQLGMLGGRGTEGP